MINVFHVGHSSPIIDARNAAFVCFMGVPGYWLSVLYLEKVGRKTVQMLGFFVMGILFLICGLGRSWFLGSSLHGGTDGTYEKHKWRQWLFLLIYGLTFLFSNFGPNTTTFVIPGEIYPPAVRATCHGISAACGKLGAACGAYFFPLLLGPGGAAHPTENGLQNCMLICSFVAMIGLLVTYLFTPRYDGFSLDEENPYLMLECECLRPSAEQLSLISAQTDIPVMSYSMVQSVEGVHDLPEEE